MNGITMQCIYRLTITYISKRKHSYMHCKTINVLFSRTRIAKRTPPSEKTTGATFSERSTRCGFACFEVVSHLWTCNMKYRCNVFLRTALYPIFVVPSPGDRKKLKEEAVCNFDFLQCAVSKASISYVRSILELIKCQVRAHIHT